MKKAIVAAVFAAILAGSVFAEGLQAYLDNITDNQSKIKTEMATGTMSVSVWDEKGAQVTNMSKSIALYLKAPNMAKIVIASDDGKKTTLAQVGDTLDQRMTDTDPIISKKVTAQSDLFTRYLGLGIDKILSGFRVKSEKALTEGIREFELVPSGKPGVIEKYIIRIDTASGMNVYESYFSKGELSVEIVKTYKAINGIYALSKMDVTTYTAKMKMSTVFDYRTISLNTKIADKEFDLQ